MANFQNVKMSKCQQISFKSISAANKLKGMQLKWIRVQIWAGRVKIDDVPSNS